MFNKTIKILKTVVVTTILCVAILLANSNQVIAEDSIANQVSFSPITNEELIDYYAAKYNANPTQLKRVAMCESKINMNPPGHNDGGAAVGMFQFHKPLWGELSKELGEDLDRYSAHDQAKAAAYAFSTGRSSRWTCK